jgi:hypothetical protein
MALVLSSACANPCSDVAPSLPPQDPTPCGAGVGLSTCPAELYCVTDAGPSACAPRKFAGAQCTSHVECYSNVCESGGECSKPPRGCGS